MRCDIQESLLEGSTGQNGGKKYTYFYHHQTTGKKRMKAALCQYLGALLQITSQFGGMMIYWQRLSTHFGGGTGNKIPTTPVPCVVCFDRLKGTIQLIINSLTTVKTHRYVKHGAKILPSFSSCVGAFCRAAYPARPQFA